MPKAQHLGVPKTGQTRSRVASIPREERMIIDKFLFALSPFSREEYTASYPSWGYGGNGWHPLEQGGTGIMRAICWYQHRYRPGSKEWRPAVIIRALRRMAAPLPF